MDKIFHIRAYRSLKGTSLEAELDLPATDYELLDLMERLQAKDADQIELEIHTAEEYDYLNERIQEPSLFLLNALARRLEKLDSRGMAVFEGLVCMDLQKGEEKIPLFSLIDYAYNGLCCHVVEDITTDGELGRFLAEGGFIPDVAELPDAAFELLDFQRIGKEHREAEGSVFTGWGYVERHSKLHPVSGSLGNSPRKPPYTVLMNIALFPNTGAHIAQPEPVPVRLPSTPEALHSALAQLGKTDWSGVMAAILDCPVPSMNKRVFLEEDISQVIEWAEAVRKLDEAGSLPKYKALLMAADCEDLTDAARLAGELDEYEFAPALHTEGEAAEAFLTENVSEDLLKRIRPHLSQWTLSKLGEGLLEAFNETLTPYGAVRRADGQPIQNMKSQPGQGGMEMH